MRHHEKLIMAARLDAQIGYPNWATRSNSVSTPSIENDQLVGASSQKITARVRSTGESTVSKGVHVTPEDVYYSPEHEWVRIDDGIATIGITDYAQEQLGDIVFVDLPAPGETVEAGSVIGELESTKSVSEIFAPIAGEITHANESLQADPEQVNSDAFGAGWLFAVRPHDSDPTSALMSAEAYTAFINE